MLASRPAATSAAQLRAAPRYAPSALPKRASTRRSALPDPTKVRPASAACVAAAGPRAALARVMRPCCRKPHDHQWALLGRSAPVAAPLKPLPKRA